MTPPLVSVCMTAYNHAPYIGRAIEGVLSQRTTFAVELVLSDDCSPDGTGAICRDYAARYPDRIRLLTGDVNVGMRANYRRTIEACRGRYVAMCDGDDWWSKRWRPIPPAASAIRGCAVMRRRRGAMSRTTRWGRVRRPSGSCC